VGFAWLRLAEPTSGVAVTVVARIAIAVINIVFNERDRRR
jgi:hypothetical protein